MTATRNRIRLRGRRWALAAGLVLAVIGCATTSATGTTGTTGGGGAQSRSDSNIDVSLPAVSGEQMRVKADPGEVVVMAFWATWCQPCQQELSKLSKVYEQMHPRGLRVYAISIDAPDTAAQVVPWVHREDYPFPVLLDRDTRVLARYNPRAEIPYYVVLDSEGRVLKDHQGYVTGDMEELQAFLDDALPAE